METQSFDILLIEDDADDAELTILALKKYHLVNPIIHIDDGEKALDFLFGTGQRPGLVLLDLKMPKVDGIQILHKLKGDPERQSIPVVAMISSREGRRYVESFDVKADAYIMKPVDFAQFWEAVRETGVEAMITCLPPSP